MSTLNIPKTDIGKVKHNLIRQYVGAIRQGVDLRTLRAVCLWSVPGVGKSQMVRQLTEELQKQTDCKVIFREIRLSNCTMNELLGLMYLNKEEQEVKYVEPPIYKEPDAEYVVYLFDELDKAPTQLKNAALQLILDKAYWQFSLPKNSIIIAACNPENIDGELFSKLPPELNNRFRHYLIEPEFECWKKWAEGHKVNHYVIDFLEANNHMLYAEDAGEEHAVFASPRGWMAVSDYLNLAELGNEFDWEDVYIDICGDLGQATALAFKSFCETKGMLPRMEDVVAGKVTKVPVKADLKHALINSMLTYIWEHRESMTDIMWSNICQYINAFPADYAATFYRNVLQLEIGKGALLQNPQFQFWKRSHGGYL